MEPTSSNLFANLLASPSHWTETAARSLFPTSRELPARVEVAIVGCGIAGAALALELVARGVPAGEIAILEGAKAAFGASGRNGGFVLSFPGEEILRWRDEYGEEGFRELLALNIRNRSITREFVESRGLWHQPGGSFFAASTPEEADEVRACAKLLSSAGFGTYRHEPTLRGPASGYLDTIFQPEDFGIHPAQYVAALLHASGAVLVEDCAVSPDAISRDGDGMLIKTSRGELRARRVAATTNAYAPIFFREVGLPTAITPGRNQAILARIDGETDNRLWGDSLYYTRRGFDYWRQFSDGTVLLGGGRDLDRDAENTTALEQNPKILAYLEGTIMPRLSGGRAVRIERRWQGTLGFTEDHLPVADWFPGFEGRMAFAGGFSGYGLGLHRVVAEKCADMLLTGKSAAPFNVERIARRRR